MRNIMIFALLMACVGCETSHIDRYEEIQNRIDKRRRQREEERAQQDKERIAAIDAANKAERAALRERVKKEIVDKYKVKILQIIIAEDYSRCCNGKVEISENGSRRVLVFRAQYDEEACIVELFE